MTLCLVTDRKRADVLRQARAAIDAGVDLIQIRERDLETADLAALVSAVVRMSRGSSTQVVVNDRVDVALACGADGVHLRGDSVPPSAVRAIVRPPFLVGRSVHSVEEARRSAGADYLIAGTVFPTTSKPERVEWLGCAGLREIVQAAPVPVLAIGGITLDRLEEIARTGAAGVAAITLFTAAEPANVVNIVAGARKRFDSAQAHP